ncbi:FkbM family methyltransferase [Flavobacterium sp.]|uniref:FkbM family methyltransferase n=1 Tax=Flavobacterium sp. TaxID=239 RepID=UPI0022C0F9C1|nr:FkbM family methyltransferase [Flavobacterium sp.]MCZ8230489.1 FkbM family methyltransferase [Flavobacterium sp.]
MRLYIYKLISKLGYRIENKKKISLIKAKGISTYNVTKQKDLLLKSYDFIQKIQQKFPELKISDYEDGVIVEIDSLKIYVETFEEFFILNEVFVQNTYNFSYDEKSVIIDIGANIGISCLYFSRLFNVLKIYAFEPVGMSYQQAMLNMSLNGVTKELVEFYNVGLGEKDKNEVFFFNRNVKGNTGVRGNLSSSFKADAVVKTKVMINDASVQLRRIIDDNPNVKIIVKMDCEGGEYDIFDNIAYSGILKEIDCLMIEWHDKGAFEIEKYLKKNGFVFFSHVLEHNSGMIYAINQK